MLRLATPQRSRPPRHVHRRPRGPLRLVGRLVMAGGMPLEAALRSHPPVERYAAAAAVVTGQQIVGARPRRPARRARPRGLRARRAAGGRPRRPRRDRRRVGAGPPRRPSHRRARVGQRRADALRAEPPDARPHAPTRSSPATAPRSARGCASRPPQRPADRHRRRHRSPAPPGRAADGDLPDRRRGSAAGRSSGTRRRDRGARRPRLRRRAPARRQRRRGRAHRGRARPGRVSRAPAGADHADRRHRVVRRTGAVHRRSSSWPARWVCRSSSASARSRCCERWPRRPVRFAA